MEQNKRKKFLGKNIKLERIKKDLNQLDLAFAANISESSISKIECGTQVPSALVLYDISKALNITVDELFKNID